MRSSIVARELVGSFGARGRSMIETAVVGTYTKHDEGGIFDVAIDGTAGTCRVVGTTVAPDPAYFCFSDDLQYVFAIVERGRGGRVARRRGF